MGRCFDETLGICACVELSPGPRLGSEAQRGFRMFVACVDALDRAPAYAYEGGMNAHNVCAYDSMHTPSVRS